MIIKLLIILFILSALYLFLIKPNNNRDTSFLDGFLYTHRGLFNNIDVAENSLKAFKLGVDLGYGTELDVHLTKDKKLVVIHDSNIKRVTGVNGIVEEMTCAELSELTLLNTEDTIPEFEDVVKVYDGKCPMIIEMKTYNNNVEELMVKVLEVTDKYPNLKYCYESFDPFVVLWLKKHRPELIRGQLSYNYLKDKKSKYNFFIKFGLTNLLMNFKTKPDFIAYDVKTKFNLSKYLTEHLFKVKQVAWTVKSQEMFDRKIKNELVIFEGFIPNVNRK